METQQILLIILGSLVGLCVLWILLLLTIRFFLANILIHIMRKLFKGVAEDVRKEFTDTVDEFKKQGKETAQEELDKIRRKL